MGENYSRLYVHVQRRLTNVIAEFITINGTMRVRGIPKKISLEQ